MVFDLSVDAQLRPSEWVLVPPGSVLQSARGGGQPSGRPSAHPLSLLGPLESTAEGPAEPPPSQPAGRPSTVVTVRAQAAWLVSTAHMGYGEALRASSDGLGVRGGGVGPFRMTGDCIGVAAA